MPTLEERADALLSAIGHWYTPEDVQLTADAIRAAVDAERERCAHIAESFIPSGFTGNGKAGNTYAVARDDRARTIAAAIRARSQE